MSNLSMYWGTFQPFTIPITLAGEPVDITDIDIYLYVKRDYADTDEEAVFTLSSVEGNISKIDPEGGIARAEVEPIDTADLPPEEKSDLFFDVRIIDDTKPYTTEQGKFTVKPVIVRKTA